MIDSDASDTKVGGMHSKPVLRLRHVHSRPVVRLRHFAAALWLGVACARPDAASRPDTAATPVDSSAEATSPVSEWVSELGPVLVVPADSDGTGMVLFPEAPTVQLLSSKALRLMATSGDTISTRATLSVADAQVCGEAPTIRLADSVAVPWTVGLVGNNASALRLDSVAGLPTRDSVRLTAELARLASSVPMDTGSRFKGLPFAVTSARQFHSGARSVIVTQLVRRLPQEAAPLEEHTFLIAEADSTSPRTWSLRYHQRSQGSEETAEQFELLAAVQGGASPLLLVARHRDSQSTYEVLQQSTTGWRSRWKRVLSC